MDLSDEGVAFVTGLRHRLEGHGRKLETEVLALANRMDLGDAFREDKAAVTREIGKHLRGHGLLTEPDLVGAKKRVVFVDIMADPDWTPPVEVEDASHDDTARRDDAASTGGPAERSERQSAPPSGQDASSADHIQQAIDELDELVHPHLDSRARAMLLWIRASLSESLSGGEPIDFSLGELIKRRGVFPPARLSNMAVRDVADFLEDHGIGMEPPLGALSADTRVRLFIGDPQRDPGTQIVEDIVKLTVVIAKADDDLGGAEQDAIRASSSSPLMATFKHGPVPLRGMVTRLMTQEESIDVLHVARRVAQWLTGPQREALMDRLVAISIADKHLDPREEAVLADIAFAFGLDAHDRLERLRELYGAPAEDREAVGEAAPMQDETVDEIMDLLGL